MRVVGRSRACQYAIRIHIPVEGHTILCRSLLNGREIAIGQFKGGVISIHVTVFTTFHTLSTNMTAEQRVYVQNALHARLERWRSQTSE